MSTKKETKPEKHAIAFVDGSCKVIDGVPVKVSGAGIFQIGEDENWKMYSQVSIDEAYCQYRNIGGELLASMGTIQHCYDAGVTHILIVHDYIGISEWANGRWNANNELTQHYRDFIQRKKLDGMKITFEFFRSHQAKKNMKTEKDQFYHKMNKMADLAAKDAILESEKER